MIVIGHTRKGNLKVVPVSKNPPLPHHPDIKKLAPSAKLHGKAYVGNQVVIHPSKVTVDHHTPRRIANPTDVQRLRKGWFWPLVKHITILKRPI